MLRFSSSDIMDTFIAKLTHVKSATENELNSLVIITFESALMKYDCYLQRLKISPVNCTLCHTWHRNPNAFSSTAYEFKGARVVSSSLVSLCVFLFNCGSEPCVLAYFLSIWILILALKWGQCATCVFPEVTFAKFRPAVWQRCWATVAAITHSLSPTLV